MIEILILFSLCKQIGQKARDKGRKATGYQFMLVMFWFGGEIVTALIAGIILGVMYGDQAESYMLIAYAAAIVGAALGALVAFQIVAMLPEAGYEEEDDDDEDDDDQYEYDSPSRKRPGYSKR